jgi:hypothetical protein
MLFLIKVKNALFYINSEQHNCKIKHFTNYGKKLFNFVFTLIKLMEAYVKVNLIFIVAHDV